ncbi:MAG: hypothetical protein COC06_07490 [Bacteroidales bacterium]|nr:MAG: hypothetical protein COC06_07490 [Bacteroidales bacterium]
MIEKIKQRYGERVQVLSVQEYFTEIWVKYESELSIEEQINECLNFGVVMISFHATIEEKNAESGEVKIIDVYPDIRVADITLSLGDIPQ